MSKTPPASVIKDGSLKANIWENTGQKGVYYTTTFAKVYKDRDGNLRDTNVFNNSDLLKVSELARQAYGRTNELRQEHLQSRDNDQEYNRMQEDAHVPTHPSDDRCVRAQEYLREKRQPHNQTQTRDPGIER